MPLFVHYTLMHSRLLAHTCSSIYICRWSIDLIHFHFSVTDVWVLLISTMTLNWSELISLVLTTAPIKIRINKDLIIEGGRWAKPWYIFWFDMCLSQPHIHCGCEFWILKFPRCHAKTWAICIKMVSNLENWISWGRPTLYIENSSFDK